MNDSPSVRQIERGSYAPHYRKSSAWIFLSSDDSKSSASSFPSGGGPEAGVDLCLSLLSVSNLFKPTEQNYSALNI
jgi:hypothetical protein